MQYTMRIFGYGSNVILIFCYFYQFPAETEILLPGQ